MRRHTLSCSSPEAVAVDEMGVRIDELENSIGELMAHGDARVRRHLRETLHIRAMRVLQSPIARF